MKKSRPPKLLKEYQAKRKFSKTPEPAGRVQPKGAALKFVVHKHAATRLHYDLRLEMGGVYRSWAVPKGPSLNPSEQRLAVRVEDHPIEYGNFEGIIPEGNYGAGTVMIWDQGTLLSRATPKVREGEKDLLRGYAEGHITFLLEGEKLKGEFALVRLKRGDPKAWLLVKKRDKFASSKNLLHDRSVVSGRTMAEIAAEAEEEGKVWASGRKVKPVRKEKSDSELNLNLNLILNLKKAAKLKQEFPHRVKLMQGVLLSEPPESASLIFSPSWNAVRGIAAIERGKASLYSKAFLPLQRRHPEVLKSLLALKEDLVLDGEIFNEKFYVSDVIFAREKDLRDLPLEKRLAVLDSLVLPESIAKLPHFDSLEKAKALAQKLGADFLVGKKRGSLYEGGLSKNWNRFSIVHNEAELALEAPPLTNLDKTYFPDDGFTKGDLISYYDSIADLILPYLLDRPESMHRQPDGLKSSGFFHKDVSGFIPRRVKTHRVNSSSSGKTLNYLLCQDRWTLLYMVNLGCIELNPWLSRVPNLDYPDYVVIDLDPDDNDFNEVIEVALAFKKLLDKIGAESFCKTSGASGLHICIPTQGKFDFDETRIFAESLCRVVQTQFPRNTSMERTPAKRRGKIYLDYLQNRRGQTLAAPYCVRPRAGATVSTPLKWSELKPGLSPEQFTIQTIRKRLAKVGDLWKPMLSKAVNLTHCTKRLKKLQPK